MTDSPASALDALGAFVEERLLAQNRELWNRHVARSGTASTSPDGLAGHLRVFSELVREVTLRPDVFAPDQRRRWRVVRSFFEPFTVSVPLLSRLAKVTHQLEPLIWHESPARRSLVPGSRRWACWFRVNNQAARSRAWQACVPVDEAFGEPFARLVGLRNELARELGHEDFWTYRLRSDSWDPDVFQGHLDRIGQATEAPFFRMKEVVTQELGRLWRRRLPPDATWPLGDPWGQTAPTMLHGHPARWIRSSAPELVRRTLAGLGWSADIFRLHVPRRVTWFPSAFCLHLNRGADIRIAANLGQDFHSLGLLLHEAGHATQYAHLDPGLPFLLRTPAHPLVSEGFSLLMQRLPFIPSWVQATRTGRRVAPPELAIRRADWCDRLFFARWVLVLAHFERAIYRDDHPDLQELYWDTVRRFQGFSPPPGQERRVDYLSKHHLITHPAGYPHYLLGACFASQLSRRLSALQGRETDPLDMDLLGRASLLGLPTTDSLSLGAFLRGVFARGADCDDPFEYAAEVCGQPFSTTAWEEDLRRLEELGGPS